MQPCFPGLEHAWLFLELSQGTKPSSDQLGHSPIPSLPVLLQQRLQSFLSHQVCCSPQSMRSQSLHQWFQDQPSWWYSTGMQPYQQCLGTVGWQDTCILRVIVQVPALLRWLASVCRWDRSSASGKAHFAWPVLWSWEKHHLNRLMAHSWWWVAWTQRSHLHQSLDSVKHWRRTSSFDRNECLI